MEFEKLGNFDVVSELGKGGMGAVYKARDKKLDRTVALKVPKKELLQNPQFAERFKREARAMARLSHPNCIQIFSIEEDDGVPFMVMEYIDGGSLSQRLASKGAMVVPEAVDYLIKICEGLSFAHLNEIIHRDIKPGNILITLDGEIKVMDFGLAKILDDDQSLTVTNAIIGTPLYMSPEQCGDGEPDARSDIYSIGILFYEMLTGDVPFRAKSPAAIIRKHLMENPVPLREINIDLPERLDAILNKMISKRPENRYQTVREMIRDLKEFKASGYFMDEDTMVDGFEGPDDATMLTERKPSTAPGAVLNDTAPAASPADTAAPAAGAETPAPPAPTFSWKASGVAAAIIAIILFTWQPWETTQKIPPTGGGLTTPTDDISVLINKGHVFLSKADLDGAENEFTKAVNSNADPAMLDKARYGLGYTLFKRKNLDKAEPCFEKIVDPDLKSDGLAAIAVMQAKYSKTIAEPSGARPYPKIILAKRHLNAGDASKALALLEPLETSTSAANDWQQAEMYCALGKAILAKNDQDKALGYFEKATTADDDSFEAWMSLAGLYDEMNKTKEAQDAFKKVQKIKPEDRIVTIMENQFKERLKAQLTKDYEDQVRKDIKDLDQLLKNGKPLEQDQDDWTSLPFNIAIKESLDSSMPPSHFPNFAKLTLFEVGSRLKKNTPFSVVDRDKLNFVLQELQLAAADLTEATGDVRLGRLLSATHYVMPTFMPYTPGTMKVNVSITVSETSELIPASVKVSAEADPDMVAKELVDEIVKEVFRDLTIQGKINSVNNEAVVLNIGMPHGLEIGDRMSVIDNTSKIIAVLDITDFDEDENAIGKLLGAKEKITAEHKVKLRKKGRKSQETSDKEAAA
ncbi:protein kinase [Candidatus Hydrogenedentota bacterium]